jgi:hypothetical protein
MIYFGEYNAYGDCAIVSIPLMKVPLLFDPFGSATGQ